MNSVENKPVKINKNMKNRMSIPCINKNKRAKLNGLSSDRRISFVTISSLERIV